MCIPSFCYSIHNRPKFIENVFISIKTLVIGAIIESS